MKLSKDFSLHEFTRSEAASRHGREIVPDAAVTEALRKLCVNVLQPLRDATTPITITSGYRPAWLNKLIGGSKTSQHMKGEAADIVAAGYSPRDLCQMIVDLRLPFDQVINEFDRWTHVSFNAQPRGQVLTARFKNGGTVYSPGLDAV